MARYKVKSIEKVKAPQGAIELSWYKFILENDKNTITNLRCGSKKEIQIFARETVNRLNEKYFTHVHFKSHKPIYEVEPTHYL